jgi:hypothetical protein
MHAPCLFFLMSPENYYLLFGESSTSSLSFMARIFSLHGMGLFATDRGTFVRHTIERR